MAFDPLGGYADTLFAENFQLLPEPYKNMTKEMLYDLNVMLDAGLVDHYTNLSRQIWITHQVAEPLQDILDIVYKNKTDFPPYKVYSGHDSNVANWLKQLNPTFDFNGIPYASSWIFELWLDPSLPLDDVSWKIITKYNDIHMTLEACDGYEICHIDDFV
jgi:hypothetical protein